jgi:hypothetical protein
MTWTKTGNVADPEASEEVKGLWNVYENEDGVSSLTEHTLKTVWTSCKTEDHYFEITDSPKREATCNKCGFIVNFIVGIDVLKDGKFSKADPIK